MKKLILTGAMLAFSAGVAMAQDMVRMGTEGAYPPYNFINDKGEVDGFERELGDKLCAMESLKCTWVKNEWIRSSRTCSRATMTRSWPG